MRILEVTCPSCSPQIPVEHEVLKQKRGMSGEDVHVEATVKCGRCETVHRAEIRVPKPIDVDAVVSSGDESTTRKVEMFPDEHVEVGDEIDDLEVTAIETDEGRTESAEAGDVETLWTREVGTVDVPVALHMGGETKSEKIELDGEEEIKLGMTLRRNGIRFTVEKILTDSGEAKEAKAKDVKRVYADSRRD